MPEHLKALIVLVVLGGATCVAIKKYIIELGMSEEDYVFRCKCLGASIVGVFISSSFWLAMLIVFAVGLVALNREKNPLALYFILMFTMPLITDGISGFGLINHFFQLNHARTLSLCLLLPAAYRLVRVKSNATFGTLLTDNLLLLYFITYFFLQLSIDSFTNTLRTGMFYPFLDAVLIYFVASRELTDYSKYKDFVASLALVGVLLSIVSIFEASKGWLLYSQLRWELGVFYGMSNYVGRGADLLRAQGSTGHPIALGMVLSMIALLMLSSSSRLKSQGVTAIKAILVAGIIASISRGPWVGAVAGLFFYLCFAENSQRKITQFILVGLVASPVLAFTSLGDKVIDYLPFIGTVDEENVTYRQLLVEVSWDVVLRNPMFGAYDFILNEEMKQLVQGEGIVDMVNSYLGIALSGGFVSLSFFVGSFLLAGGYCLAAMKSLAKSKREEYSAAVAALAALICMAVTLGTTSQVTVIPYFVWLVLGLCVSRRHIANKLTRSAVRRSL
jgi:O-antigen ligase